MGPKRSAPGRSGTGSAKLEVQIGSLKRDHPGQWDVSQRTRPLCNVVILFTPMKVTVIIPAAGLGTRMAPAGKKGVPSKQFSEINGTPIVIHTLRVFAR